VVCGAFFPDADPLGNVRLDREQREAAFIAFLVFSGLAAFGGWMIKGIRRARQGSKRDQAE